MFNNSNEMVKALLIFFNDDKISSETNFFLNIDQNL